MLSNKEGAGDLNLQISHIKEALIDDKIETDKKSSSWKSFTSFTRRERIAILLAIAAQLLWAFNVIAVKFGSKCDKFNANNYSMWRSVFLIVLVYAQLKRKNTPIPRYSEVQHKFWFLMRTFGNYFCYTSLILAIVYLRAATASCLAAANPFVIIFLSVWVLHEQFYIRYLIGIIVCFVGSAMIMLNEKHGGAQSVPNANIPLGLLFAVIHIFLVAGCIFGQKVVVNDGMVTDVWVFYLAVYNGLTGFVICFFDGNFGLNFGLIIIAGINAVIFYYGQVLTDMALERMDVSKYAPSGYIQTLFVFILSMILFGESFYFTDVIGSFLIISFHFYNAYDPIKPQRKK